MIIALRDHLRSAASSCFFARFLDDERAELTALPS